jgi:CheY-like chemotaxis protein
MSERKDRKRESGPSREESRTTSAPETLEPAADACAPRGDVFLVAPIDEAGGISRAYVLLVESEMDTRALLAELLGDECRPLEVGDEDDALLFLKSGVVPCLLLVQLHISAPEAWVLADLIREYPAFRNTTVQELSSADGRANCLARLGDLLELCSSSLHAN